MLKNCLFDNFRGLEYWFASIFAISDWHNISKTIIHCTQKYQIVFLLQFQISKNWFHIKFQWQKNSRISSLWSFHLNNFVFQDGHWVWESSGVPISTYSNWASGQPTNGGGNEDCLFITDHRGDNKWYNVKCDQSNYRKPLCQMPRINTWKT